MPNPRPARRLPDDLYDYVQPTARREGRRRGNDGKRWTVTDDWPEAVPVTEAEIAVFQSWFGDILDLLSGTS